MHCHSLVRRNSWKPSARRYGWHEVYRDDCPGSSVGIHCCVRLSFHRRNRPTCIRLPVLHQYVTAESLRFQLSVRKPVMGLWQLNRLFLGTKSFLPDNTVAGEQLFRCSVPLQLAEHNTVPHRVYVRIYASCSLWCNKYIYKSTFFDWHLFALLIFFRISHKFFQEFLQSFSDGGKSEFLWL